MDEAGIETTEPIFELATECESLFSEHISRLKNEFDLNGAKVVGEYQHRFSAWAAFLGVFAVPDMCLDRRLRNHTEVQDLVLRLLDIMKRNLVYLLETDHNKPTFGKEDIDMPDSDQASSPQIRVNLECLRGIEGAVVRLNHLERTIQRSSEAGQATKVGKFITTFDSTPFSEIARLAVKSFYPGASASLLEQLIQAMTDMYERFHYRRLRQARLQARPKAALSTIGEEPASDSKADAERSSLQPVAPPKLDVNKQLPRLISRTHLDDKSHKSRESKPTSLDSREFSRLFPQRKDGSIGSKTRSILVSQVAYPQPSEETLVCEWCFATLSKDDLKGEKWKKHLNEDLKPFICISEKCNGQVNRFATSRAWFNHMLETHGQNWHREIHLPVWWICPLCNSEETTFSRAQDLSEHISKLHDDIFTRTQIQVIVRQSQFRSPRPQDICPLCCLSMRDEDKDKEVQYSNVAQSDLQIKDQTPGKSHKRIKTETGSIQQIQKSDVGAEGEMEETASNIGTQAAQNTQRVNIEAISRHVAAHLQSLMLFTLRILSLDVTNATADEKSSSSSTDHDSSRVGSGQQRSEQETGTVVDILEEQDNIMDIDDPSIEDTVPESEHIIDWQDIINDTQQYSGADSFLQEIIRTGAFHYQGHEEYDSGRTTHRREPEDAEFTRKVVEAPVDIIESPNIPTARTSIQPPRNKYFVCPEDVLNRIIKQFGDVALPGEVAQQDHAKIYRTIKNPPHPSKMFKGIIYIYEHTSISGVFKIGYSTRSAQKRHRGPGNCYANDTRIIYESEKSFIGAHQAERIIHAVLKHKRILIYNCLNCSSAHREWFLTSRNEALEIVKSAESWLQMPAYYIHQGRYELLPRAEVIYASMCSFSLETLNQYINSDAQHNASDVFSVNPLAATNREISISTSSSSIAGNGISTGQAGENSTPVLPISPNVQSSPLRRAVIALQTMDSDEIGELTRIRSRKSTDLDDNEEYREESQDSDSGEDKSQKSDSDENYSKAEESRSLNSDEEYSEAYELQEPYIGEDHNQAEEFRARTRGQPNEAIPDVGIDFAKLLMAVRKGGALEFRGIFPF